MASATIFIPTYKRPHLLGRAVLSALNQTWKDLQVVVCDDESRDETAALIRDLQVKDARLQYFCHENNIGMLANYAFALSKLKTPFYSFLSDDDFLFPNFCEEAINAFTKHPEIGFFAGSALIVSKKHGVLRVPIDLWPREGLYMPEEGVALMINRYPLPTTVMFRKTAEIDTQNQEAWDCDYLLQLASKHPFVISKKPCGIMLNHEASFTSHLSYKKTRRSIQRLMERTNAFLPDAIKGPTQTALQNHFNEVLFYSVLSHLSKGESKEAWKLSRSSICKLVSLSCMLFPPLRFLLPLLRKLKHIKRRRHFRDYEAYMQYL